MGVEIEGRLEVLVLAGILLAVAGLWIFGAVAAEKVMEGGNTQKFDDHILLALRRPGDLAVPIGPGWSVQVARDLTAFGGPVGSGNRDGGGVRLPPGCNAGSGCSASCSLPS